MKRYKLYSLFLILTLLAAYIVPIYAEEAPCHIVGLRTECAAFVHSGSADQPGSAINPITLIAGRGRETFLRFDLSSVDKTAIQRVSLDLTVEHGGKNPFSVFVFGASQWDQTITYHTKPDTTDEKVIAENVATGAGNRRTGEFSVSSVDVTDAVKAAGDLLSLHITGGENGVEFASPVSAYADRVPTLRIYYGEAAEADYEAAFEDTCAYLSSVQMTEPIHTYMPLNGLKMSISWTDIRDNTLTEEKGSYTTDAYLHKDGTLTRPKWFEGTKKLKVTARLTSGERTRDVSNLILTLPPEDTPNFSGVSFQNYVDIGSEESEQAQQMDMIRASEPKTREVGGAVYTYRTLDKNGSMGITLACNPEQVNYFTVKLWGGDTGEGMLWVCDPQTGYINADKTRQPMRNGMGVVDRRDWVEVNTMSTSPQYDGGFIYATYEIPMIYTQGRNYVSLRLYSTGGNNDYAAVTIKEQKTESRGIYAVYMTQDADFNPSEFEDVTGALAPMAPVGAIDFQAQKKLLQDYAYTAIETFKSWQIYGADNYPSYMEGMQTRKGDWKKKKLSDTDWKNVYYNTSCFFHQNLTPMNMYELYALAYQNADQFDAAHTIDKADLLAREVAGVDFLVRAQGANGGFYSEDGWIGGPNRRDANTNQHLTGFGLRSVGAGILQLYDEIEAKGYFDADIDADADGVTETNRKTAWAQMLASARDYLFSLDGCGHAPNQDMADIAALLRFEKILQNMNSDLSWKAQGKEANIEQAIGIGLGFEVSKATSSYWVSPKGLILENFGSLQGGYSGDYGINALPQLAEIVELACEYYREDEQMLARCQKLLDDAYAGAESFMFTANAEAGASATQYSEGIISNRNGVYPGTVRYPIDVYGARSEYRIAVKSIANLMAHERLTTQSDGYRPGNAHFADNVLDAMKLYVNFDTLAPLVKKAEDQAYLMEDNTVDEYVWADEMGRNVVIKNGDDKIYFALNWRNPVYSQNYYNSDEVQNRQSFRINNLARFHHKTSSYDKYGYAQMITNGWSSTVWENLTEHGGYMDAFMYLHYGDYVILMNSTGLFGEETGKSYPIPVSDLKLDGAYRDLTDGTIYAFGDMQATENMTDGSAIQIAPATTMVLYPYTAPSPSPTPSTEPSPTPSTEPSPTPSTEPSPTPSSKPSPTPAPETKIAEVSYQNGEAAVTIESVCEGGDTVVVYAAEYQGDMLTRLRVKSVEVTQPQTISLPYPDGQSGNLLKIFVWNQVMEPFRKEPYAAVLP